MALWNDIPFDENATPEEKALEFDLQFEENSRPPEQYPNIANYEEKNK